MKAIFKISDYNPETQQITIRYCRLNAPKPIDEYRPVSIDLEGRELDLYDCETFIQTLMRTSGEKWITRNEESEDLLPENIPESIKGKLDIESLVGRVISCDTHHPRRELIKMRKVEL